MENIQNAVLVQRPMTLATESNTVKYSIEDLEKRIMKMYDIPEGLKVESRKSKYVSARHLFILMLKNFNKSMTWKEASTIMKRDNHSTTVHMFKAAISDYSIDVKLRTNYLMLCRLYNKNPYIILNFHKGDTRCCTCGKYIVERKNNLRDTIFYYDRNVSDRAKYEHTTCHNRRRRI